VENKINEAWKKWKELSGVVFDRKMPVEVKGQVYKTMFRLERMNMRMLRWILGVLLKDLE